MGKKLFYKISFCIHIYCYYGDCRKFIFHRVVQQHSLGVVVYLVTSLLQIFNTMCR